MSAAGPPRSTGTNRSDRVPSWTSQADFAGVAVRHHGMTPAGVRGLQLKLDIHRQGGCTEAELTSFFHQFAPWVRIHAPRPPRTERTSRFKPMRPTLLYPSDMLLRAMTFEDKPEIALAFGKQKSGKSTLGLHIIEQWMRLSRKWEICRQLGPAEAHIYGDHNGFVPAMPGVHRCPSDYVLEREVAGNPVFRMFDEVPTAMRATRGVTNELDAFVESLLQTRHRNLWTWYNVIQPRILQARIRQMQAVMVDKELRGASLRERLELISEGRQYDPEKELLRELIPLQRKTTPAIATLDLDEDLGEEGHWITHYPVHLPSWTEDRDMVRKKTPWKALETAACWPRGAVVQRLLGLLVPIVESARGSADGGAEWQSVLGKSANSQHVLQALVEHSLGRLGFVSEAVAEITEAVPGQKGARAVRERLGWINRRQPLPDIEPHLVELGEEIPATQRRPFMPIGYASWAAGQPEHRLAASTDFVLK